MKRLSRLPDFPWESILCLKSYNEYASTENCYPPAVAVATSTVEEKPEEPIWSGFNHGFETFQWLSVI